MLERIRMVDWLLEVDIAGTKTTYDQLLIITCTCTYCRNYLAAIELLPKNFLDICNALSIDPRKAAEVWEVPFADGTHYYGGWYHLVGRVVTERNSGLLQVGATSLLSGGFTVSFTDRIALVPEDFPTPMLQMAFTGKVPWVLGEPPEPEEYLIMQDN